MQYLRSKFFDLFAILWTLSLSPSWPVLWLFGSPVRPLRAVAQFWVSGLLFGLKHFVGLTYIERDHKSVPKQPFLIIANHQSTFETLVLSHLFPTAAFVTKYETKQYPAIGWFLTNYPMIMINRNLRDRAIPDLAEQACKVLAEGRPVILFPEGTRKQISDPIEFKPGGMKAICKRFDPIVLPIALNSGLFWPPNKKHKLKSKPGPLEITLWLFKSLGSYLVNYMHSGTAVIWYLRPIMPGLSEKQLVQRAQETIHDAKEKLRLETTPAQW